MGVVTRAHGIRGEVVVKWFGGDPEGVSSYKMYQDEQGTREYRIDRARPLKGDTFVAHFTGVDSRDDADSLRGTSLFVYRDTLPPTNGEEFYLVDLVGLNAVDGDGRPVGRVLAMHNFGAGDIIEIEPTDGSATTLLPFTHDSVPEVEIGRRVVVKLPPQESEKS
ncbi:MAG: 16S rRNA processing protein RimM [Alphaproteobacteria bacterium]|nr:16S rRNA processing protein RimM [Alphaproteobacteria bacterium]